MIIPELLAGGAQRSFSQLCTDLSTKYEVQVVIFNMLAPVAYEIGVPIRSLQVKGGGNYFEKIYLFLLRVFRLRRLKNEFRPAVTISFLEGANYVNILSAIGEKVIISVRATKDHDLEIKGILGLIRKKLFIPHLYRRASHVVTVAYHLEKEMIFSYKLNPGRVTTIHNYYDLTTLAQKVTEPLPTQFESWLSGDILVNVGRLHSQKNQEFLIRIFPEILARNPLSKLVIIGDGPLRGYLLDGARNTGIATYSVWEDTFSDDYGIYFLGEHLNPLPFLKRADAFLLPSLYEGFPNVLIEAMIAGLPVLAADCKYGPKEILIGENTTDFLCGELLPPTDSNEPNSELIWIERVAQLIVSKDLLESYRAKGRERASYFSRERILTKWLDLIEDKTVDE